MPQQPQASGGGQQVTGAQHEGSQHDGSQQSLHLHLHLWPATAELSIDTKAMPTIATNRAMPKIRARFILEPPQINYEQLSKNVLPPFVPSSPVTGGSDPGSLALLIRSVKVPRLPCFDTMYR